MDAEFWLEDGARDPLDLYSTSPTKSDLCCSYHAPFFAVPTLSAGRWSVLQGCCNHWDCPRCGQMVAARHYGKIVEGAREIARDHQMWFITLTCRGADLREEEATENYLAWTSKFLDAARLKAKRAGEDWYYVQVTEKQKRGHPHSHILTSFQPGDLIDGFKLDWKRDNSGQLVAREVPALRSEWMLSQSVRSGLGDQYDISAVRTVEAASRYVAKYMFKKSQFSAKFPKGWKRVRYSQSWPEKQQAKTGAFVLLSAADWHNLAALALVVDAAGAQAYSEATFMLRGHDVILREKQERERNGSN